MPLVTLWYEWQWSDKHDQEAACSFIALGGSLGQGGRFLRAAGEWGDWHRVNLPQFWVKKVGQTGTMARHITQKRTKML